MSEQTSSLYFRILLFVGLFASVFLMPAWFTFALAIVPLFFYKQYGEFFVIALILDLTFASAPGTGMLWGSVFYLLLGMIVYLGVLFLKQRLFAYRR